MGSLMAGWDSPVQDPKHLAFERNKSFTKEEIEAYWRSKKKTDGEEEEDQEEATSPCSPTWSVCSDDLYHHYGYGGTDGRTDKVFRRLNSLPASTADACKEDSFVEINWENIVKSKGWWTSSSWAFLNEPPVTANSSYTSSHFQVANFRSHTKLNGGE
ncbi:hypothetical protein SAY87_004883 [Trapa incisa]|uniref:Uncharacterized protein n=2 Tax=Trapa TaxID=22665 RepID=A0AAN7LIM1_TRANT|nr:hypothetical protein SAY87_004883 [Trapa incisa]KAK4781371.1 hypothetical protein SAY86_015473 [Trapa natans]